MATLTEIKRYIEGTDLLGEVQNDIRGIEGNSLADWKAGYNDLTLALEEEPEYADLFSDSYSIGKDFIVNTQQAATAYLKSTSCQVNGAYGGGLQNLNVETGDQCATKYDLVVGDNFSVTYGYSWDQHHHDVPNVTANWNDSNSINQTTVYNTTYHDIRWIPNQNGGGNYVDFYGGDAEFRSEGSGDSWFQYIHFSGGGDPSALNSAGFLV